MSAGAPSYESPDFAWLEHWADAHLTQRFGGICVQRARRYADGGNVLRVWAESTAKLVAEVRGTGRAPYRCTVSVRWLGRDGQTTLTWLSSSCSCPVAVDCKHGVAAVMVARAQRIGEDLAEAERQGLPEPTPEWERALSGIVRDAAARSQAREQLQEVALRFSKQQRSAGRFGAYAPSRSPEITIRPMVRGASGRWIKTGIDWERLDLVRPTLEPDQFDALLAIRRLQVTNRYSYQNVPDEMPLGQLGPRVWERIVAAEQAGVTLIGEKLPKPHIVLDPASVELLAERGDEGGLHLHVRVRHEQLGIDANLAGGEPGGAPARGALQLGGSDRLWLVGAAPNALAVWGGERLVFAPLTAPLEPHFRTLVDGRPLSSMT